MLRFWPHHALFGLRPRAAIDATLLALLKMITLHYIRTYVIKGRNHVRTVYLQTQCGSIIKLLQEVSNFYHPVWRGFITMMIQGKSAERTEEFLPRVGQRERLNSLLRWQLKVHCRPSLYFKEKRDVKHKVRKRQGFYNFVMSRKT